MYCNKCGTKLIDKYLEHEGMIPYCSNCNEYRFKMFNTAVSMIILSPNQDQILLIKQYHKDAYILCAGYVNHSENLEQCLQRELYEELHLHAISYHYNKSLYFPKSNTLLVNFIVVVDSLDLSNISTWEVDEAKWFSFEEAKANIKPNSYAKQFLIHYLDNKRGL